MKSEVLITNINYEQYGEDVDAVHPFRDFTFAQVKEFITEIEKKYPTYENFRFEKNAMYHGKYGATSEWYELLADPIPSKLQKVLE